MSMYNDYTFEVKAVHPSGLLQYQSGKASSSRQFIVTCKNAEEFALRQIGKFYAADIDDLGLAPIYPFPVLPSPFPASSVPVPGDGSGQLELVASSFAIEPICPECFNSNYLLVDEETLSRDITNPTLFKQMERYFFKVTNEGELVTDEGEEANDELVNRGCLCLVTIGYEENPCDCLSWDSTTFSWESHAEILPGTCVSVERNPAYEMFTLPSTSLVWKNLLDPVTNEPAALKSDTYAYKIIPKADIIVHWHNIPTSSICQIENHLKSFRGTVNQEEWGGSISCYDDPTNLPGSGDDRVDCNLYEPETILFVDWQEDRSRRTNAFGGYARVNEIGMNTTTLKLFFKQKRVEFEANDTNSVSDDDTASADGDAIAGWNHLFVDSNFQGKTWMRVVVESTDKPVFPLRAFSDIFYPVL